MEEIIPLGVSAHALEAPQEGYKYVQTFSKFLISGVFFILLCLFVFELQEQGEGNARLQGGNGRRREEIEPVQAQANPQAAG